MQTIKEIVSPNTSAKTPQHGASYMESFLIILFVIFFALLAWHRFQLALAWFFLLLPAYLIRFHIGPLPTTLLETMVWIILFVWIIKNIKNLFSTFYFLFSKYLSLSIAIALFLTAATISVLASTNTRAALGEWKAFYVEPFLLFLVLISSLKEKKTADFILGALVLSGLATSLLAIYQHFTGWMVPWFFWANGNSYRVTAWYGFPNAVGLFLAPLVPLAIYLIREQWKKIQELSRRGTTFNTILQYKILAVAVLFIPTALLAILFAKSTGGLIGVAAGIGVLLLL